MIEGIEGIEKKLVALEARREKVMQLSRESIRLCGKAISLMHAKEMAKAGRLVSELKGLNSELKKLGKGFEYYSLQAHQEYTEMLLLYYVLRHSRIATLREAGTDGSAYLLGMLDLVGELKREAFDAMRKRELGRADQYYRLMLNIYDSTLHMRFANSLLPDFRKKQDVARIQIEGLANELNRLQTDLPYSDSSPKDEG